MGWRDRHQQGSFRGIPFQMDVGEDERGQRLVVHEFPGRDKPYLEGMGRTPNRFTVEAFLVGDDHLDRRDALQEACLKAGAGELVHPFYGKLQAECESIKTRHDKTELRLTRVQMVFLEVGALQPVVRAINTQARATLSAMDVVSRQKSAFENAFDYVDLPYSAAQETLAVVQGAVDEVSRTRSRVAQTAAFAQKVVALKAQVSTLILTTSSLAQEFIDLITFGLLTPEPGQQEAPDARSSYTGLAPLFTYSPVVALESAPANAFGQFVRGVAVAQGGHLLSQMEFESVEEAGEMKGKLFLAMDALAAEQIDDHLFAGLHALRADVERDVSERAVQLPRVVEVTLPDFTSAVLLSYRLYGTVTQEDSILRRNRIAHPGILPSDTPLKVVTDA